MAELLPECAHAGSLEPAALARAFSGRASTCSCGFRNPVPRSPKLPSCLWRLCGAWLVSEALPVIAPCCPPRRLACRNRSPNIHPCRVRVRVRALNACGGWPEHTSPNDLAELHSVAQAVRRELHFSDFLMMCTHLTHRPEVFGQTFADLGLAWVEFDQSLLTPGLTAQISRIRPEAGRNRPICRGHSGGVCVCVCNILGREYFSELVLSNFASCTQRLVRWIVAWQLFVVVSSPPVLRRERILWLLALCIDRWTWTDSHRLVYVEHWRPHGHQSTKAGESALCWMSSALAKCPASVGSLSGTVFFFVERWKRESSHLAELGSGRESAPHAFLRPRAATPSDLRPNPWVRLGGRRWASSIEARSGRL